MKDRVQLPYSVGMNLMSLISVSVEWLLHESSKFLFLERNDG